MKTVLITGASGDVATHLRRELATRYKLRRVSVNLRSKLEVDKRI